MLRTIAYYAKITNARNFTTAAVALKLEKFQRVPVITCKNTGLNLYTGDRCEDDIKFGELPLASRGWKHRKSKGDFFILHPTVQEDQIFDITQDLSRLKEHNIHECLIENLQSELEIKKLTCIQNDAIGKIMEMNHVLIAAETGCGKTLAYLVPIIQQILNVKAQLSQRNLNTPLALILTPGRELATQVASIAEKLCKNLDVSVHSLLGGSTKQKMLNPEFNDIDILVGTIGAVSKLTTTGIYKVGQIRHVVLDEADTLLDDSFSDKLCYFLRKFPFHRNHLTNMNDEMVGTQLILASATMPTNISELLYQIVDTETIHEIVSPNLHKLMPHIKQKFIRMNKSDRPGNLLTLVKSELKKHRPLIIFGNKSATSDFVSLFLNNSGVNCINLNGDMLMKIRVGRFEKFQNGEVDVLSTTDVGSRGLDTTRARHVINFDFPLHVADYIHRCGRIGRVGSHDKCLVTNFVSGRNEVDVVQKIEHTARTRGILPNVNANITNLIQKKIISELNLAGSNLD